MSRRIAAPWWFTAIILILFLPAFSIPAMLGIDTVAAYSGLRTMVFLYPAALAIAGWAAWASYSERPTVAWLMAAVMAATDAAMFYLIFFAPTVTSF